MTKEQEKLVESNNWDSKAVEAYLALGIGDDDLSDFEEAYYGKFDDDEDFARAMAEDTTSIRDKEFQGWPFYCIDWEWASRELMVDYSEQDGYYFRDL